MHRRASRWLLPVLAAAILLLPGLLPARAAPEFFFRNKDRVVMIGDSITEQHLHSNYVEIYTVSRFPKWTLAFRNAGIGGDTSTGGNRRAARDVLSFHPTAVTITFGMNDAGYGAVDPQRLEKYVAGLQGLIDQIRPTGARVALLSTSPVEYVTPDQGKLEHYNQTLEQYAASVKEVAGRDQLLFVDQFHPHLAILEKAHGADPATRINGGDAVHPGPAGQWLMAWAILKGLGAPSLVSNAEVDARSRIVTQREGCTIDQLRKLPEGVAFDRSDDALTCYIQPEARPMLSRAPIVEDLDRYLLTVKNLPEGRYTLAIDGETCATLRASDLASGYNMALLDTGPIARQAKAVHDAVFAKNKYYHDQIFRGVVLNPQVPEEQKAALIEERAKGMRPLEDAIREALQLKPHRFEIMRKGGS